MSERVSPHSLEAERSVLGAILMQPDAVHIAAELLAPDDFFRDAHRHIFRAMLSLPAASIEFTTVMDALTKQRSEIGGPAYLASLVDGMPRASNVGAYAKMVKDRALMRGIIAVSKKAEALAFDGEDDPALVVDKTFSDLLTLSSRATGPGLTSARDALPAAIAELEELASPNSRAWGHRSQIAPLDRMLRGFRPGKLILIAARPGGGKTSLAMNIAKAVAKQNESVAVFSLEQTKSELMLALISSEARINIEDLADEKLTPEDWGRVSQAYETIANMPLYIDDHTDLSPVTLRAKARRLQIEHGLSMLVVDYVQLMQGLPTSKRNESEHEKLTGISRSFKLLAKDLRVPVIVCCQLNRAPEARGDGRPGLSDLRGSGSLEQDADDVVLIHDPSKFPQRKRKSTKTTDIVREEIEKGVYELIVAKHRGGRTGIVRALFRAEYVTFEGLAL